MTIHSTTAFRAVKSITLLALVALMLVVALFVGAQATSAQGYPNPGYAGPGQFCVDDTGLNPLNCTANDTKISNISPTISEVCLTAGDTTTAQFTLDLIVGADTRYDVSMYIATGAAGTGTALNGSACYKDVLQPVGALNAASNALNPAGTGPFLNTDGDLCGEGEQGDPNDPGNLGGAIYKLQQPVTITCNDVNNDGVVDPISTCLGWANNANQYTCNAVSALVPGPGTAAKCRCDEVAPDPPILLYKGYDFGDLLDTYGTLLPNGARHAIQDTNNDGTPNVQGVVPAIWLGSVIDYSNSPAPTPLGETNGQPGPNADGDDLAYLNDEDGVSFPGPWYVNIPNGGKATVVVSASDPTACDGNKCWVAFWIDWGGTVGSFDEPLYPAGEYYVQSVDVGTNNLTFTVPSGGWTSPLAVRFRLYYEPLGAQGSYLPTGLAINGEVEDYKVSNSPLGVTLADFSAQQVSDYVLLTWETNSELNNRGFNLFRGTSNVGPDRQLNETLIPSQSQGNPGGFIYTWEDHADLIPGTTYFYWVEDVDLSGTATRHGPVGVAYTGPTAVTVSSVQANPIAVPYAVPLAGTLLALLVPLAGALAVRRRRA